MPNKITVLIDVVADRANASVKGFKQSIADADTTVGKFKAAGTQAMGLVKENAAQLAAAGGAALVAFGAKAVAAFQDLALSAEKFADATGQSTQEASRWIEVAGDLGISTDTVTTAFVRMERAAATGGGAFSKYGIEIAKTDRGAVDVTQTFLNAVTAIQRIPDANKRAMASNELFGRGYAEIAELIDTKATDIRESLDSVSDAKVIDPEEVEKAKRLRDALDSLRDTLDDLTLAVGEGLVPVVAEAAETMRDAAAVAGNFKKAFDVLPGPVNKVLGQLANFPGTMTKVVRAQTDFAIGAGKTVTGWLGIGGGADKASKASGVAALAQQAVAEAVDDVAAATIAATERSDELTEAQRTGARTARYHAEATKAEEQAVLDAAAAQEAHTEAMRLGNEVAQAATRITEDLLSKRLQLVGGDIAVREAQRQATDAANELNEVMDAGESSMDDIARALDGAKSAYLGAAQAAADMKVDQAEANGEQVTGAEKARIMAGELAALADKLAPGSPLRVGLQEYIAELLAVPRVVQTEFVATPRRNGSTRSAGGDIARRTGGPIPGPRDAPVPITAHGGEFVLSADVVEAIKAGRQTLGLGFGGGRTAVAQSSATAAAGIALHVHVTATGLGASSLEIQRAVVEAVRQHVRFNGPIAGIAR